jgi:exodeoxyribonuclease-1
LTSNNATFLFHDYETWGVDPRYDFPCQFAAIRTDENLEIIGKPISYYCQIPNDYLPQPEACLVTGITPQQSLRDGLIEAEFASKINQLMSHGNTCTLGYNSIKFDDEVSRHLFYRNFYDPYEREYANQNSRWDLIDLARACYALRPEGLNWPTKENGAPSFKLEELSKANGIEHQDAHDAISDVKATIEFAKQLKNAQPRLFNYYYDLRKKHQVTTLIDFNLKTPLVYISGVISPHYACTTLVLPICPHPINKNAVVCLDLRIDPSDIFDLETDVIKARLYDSAIPFDQRPGIKVIHLNKSPFLVSSKVITDEIALRCKLDLGNCREYLRMIQNRSMTEDDISIKLTKIYESNTLSEPEDIDGSLYSRGFLNSADKLMLEKIRGCKPESLVTIESELSTAMRTQLFRYRARNFPNSLDASEIERWQRHRHMRFTDGAKKTCLSVHEFQQKLIDLSSQHSKYPKKLRILRDLEQYLVSIF